MATCEVCEEVEIDLGTFDNQPICYDCIEKETRADERAKTVAEIVAWLRGQDFEFALNIPERIERGEHEKSGE
jgi:hypothetical protein